MGPEPETQGREPRAQAKSRSRDVPHINWEHLMNKTTKAIKGTPHVIDGKEIGGDQKRMDAILEPGGTY